MAAMATHPEYAALDLGGILNAPATLLPADPKLPEGPLAFHGLPFVIGTGTRSLLAAGGDRMDPVAIPIGRSATWIIVAHRLLESKLMEGDPVGRPVADWAVKFSDGTEHILPVRERLEIGILPVSWGQWPILAAPDQPEGMSERGRNGGGGRQTEAYQGYSKWFWLMAWPVPESARTIERIEIRPKGPRFVVGGVCLSNLPEEPFTRAAKVPVKIVLPNASDAERRFDLAVEVDRGTATWPYALPKASAESFITDPMTGWGEEQNHGSSPAYVEIAANPSATITLRQGQDVLGTAKLADLTKTGEARPNDRLHLITVEPGRNWVKTTVLDADTNQPVPCRIHFRSPDGIPYQPHGHHDHVNSNQDTWHIDNGGDLRLGQITYAYIDGICEGWLPRGEVIVDAARGWEYQPIREKLTIKPGQRELRLKLKRIRHMAKERWFSGDSHVHFISTQGGHREASGEGLDVVNLLLSQWGHLFTNTEEFTGAPSINPKTGTIVYATQENRQHILGHLTLLGLKEPVMPWCSDGPSEAELGGNLETTLSRWADACRAQGGTVVIPHLPNPNCEPATLIATGRADAIEMFIHDPYMHLEYYRYLNAGYRLPIVGGTDKMTSDVPVGLYRTYVKIPDHEPFTYENWCKYLRAGATFQSGGPLLDFTVDGRPIGATINLASAGTVEVSAAAQSVLPIHSLEIVMNGNVVARTEETKGTKTLSLKATVKIEKHSWIVARCAGPNYTSIKHHDGWRRGIMAHTSPIYLAVGGPWWMFSKESAEYMLTLIHGGLEYVKTRSKQWQPGTVTHHHGNDDHMKFLEEPFQQAIEAIHRRLHDHNIPH